MLKNKTLSKHNDPQQQQQQQQQQHQHQQQHLPAGITVPPPINVLSQPIETQSKPVKLQPSAQQQHQQQQQLQHQLQEHLQQLKQKQQQQQYIKPEQQAIKHQQSHSEGGTEPTLSRPEDEVQKVSILNLPGFSSTAGKISENDDMKGSESSTSSLKTPTQKLELLGINLFE